MGTDKKHRYLLIHTPFWRLCVEAERVGLKMPLKNVRIRFNSFVIQGASGRWGGWGGGSRAKFLSPL